MTRYGKTQEKLRETEGLKGIMKAGDETVEKLRKDAEQIVQQAIQAVQPDSAVIRALETARLTDRIILVSIGKAAWQMARCAAEYLGERVQQGVVCTKYQHCIGDIPGIVCFEGGHPTPDENSFAGTQYALEITKQLKESDTVLFLVSGGGSALFEKPLVSTETLQDVTQQLLACGASIVEMNTVRKRLSAVKGGRFAEHCLPAKVFQIVLSDIIGDPLDMIASGPAYPDTSTSEDALNIVKKYGLELTEETLSLLRQEPPKELHNVTTCITGSVRELCRAASDACVRLGYEPVLLTDRMNCEAREAGRFLASIARTHTGDGKRLAFIAGGETVVHLTGTGRGGRNQELVLAAVPELDGLTNAAVFSVGSDGTDGPTDAAGGYADGETGAKMRAKGIDALAMLNNNDAYNALGPVDGLIVTGPTGTNVNDFSMVLLDA